MPAVGAANGPVYITSTLTNSDTVKCIVTNTDPCGEAAMQSVVITVTPNTGTGVKITGSDDAITVLPNPSKGAFTVKGTLAGLTDEDVTLGITDMLGQQVYSNTVTAKGGNLNAEIMLSSSIASGSYLLNVHTATGNKVFHIVLE